MKDKYLVLLVLGVVVTAAGILGIASAVQHNSAKASCSNTGVRHLVTIQNNHMTPTHVDGKLCDTLKITNLDTVTREIGFGEHDHHTAYDGVTERLLRKDQSVTVTLTQKGEHSFHDHFHDEVAATFSVD